MNTPSHRLDNGSAHPSRRGSHFSASTEDETLFSHRLEDVLDPAQAQQVQQAQQVHQAYASRQTTPRHQTPQPQQASQAKHQANAKPAARSLDLPSIVQVTKPMAAQPQAQVPAQPPADPFATRVVDLSAQAEPAYQTAAPEGPQPAFDPFEYQPSAYEAASIAYAPTAPAYVAHIADAQEYSTNGYENAPAYSESDGSYHDEAEDSVPRFSEFSPVKKTLFVATVVLLLACIVAESLAIFVVPSLQASPSNQAESATSQTLKTDELADDPNTLQDE